MEITLVSIKGSERQMDKLFDLPYVISYSCIGFSFYDLRLRVPEGIKGLNRFKTLKGLTRKLEEIES